MSIIHPRRAALHEKRGTNGILSSMHGRRTDKARVLRGKLAPRAHARRRRICVRGDTFACKPVHTQRIARTAGKDPANGVCLTTGCTHQVHHQPAAGIPSGGNISPFLTTRKLVVFTVRCPTPANKNPVTVSCRPTTTKTMDAPHSTQKRMGDAGLLAQQSVKGAAAISPLLRCLQQKLAI